MSEFRWRKQEGPYYPPELKMMSGGSDDGLVDVYFVRNQWRWCAIPAEDISAVDFKGTAADQASAMKAAEDFIVRWTTLTVKQRIQLTADQEYEDEYGEDDGD